MNDNHINRVFWLGAVGLVAAVLMVLCDKPQGHVLNQLTGGAMGLCALAALVSALHEELFNQ